MAYYATEEDKAFLSGLPDERLCAMHDEIHRIMNGRAKLAKARMVAEIQAGASVSDVRKKGAA